MNEHKHTWDEQELGDLRAGIEKGFSAILREAFRLDAAQLIAGKMGGQEPRPRADRMLVFFVGALVMERFEYQNTGETMCDECLFTLVKELRKKVWEECPFPSPHPTA